MTARWVLDASALLAWLQQEPGADVIDPLLSEAAISTANWSEVLQKVAQRGKDAREVSDLLRALGVEPVPLTVEDAADAATLWLKAPSLSLRDRCCLALARRLGTPAVTADQDWIALKLEVQIQTIR
jgi:ribonuclease VapC